MSRKASKRVAFTPDIYDTPTMFLEHPGSTKDGRNRRRVNGGFWTFMLARDSQFLPREFFRRLGDKAAKVLRIVSNNRSSPKVSSSAQFVRSRSLVDQSESHRAEAIEDCIEFLNSSCSLQRSNSVSSAC